MSWERFAIHFVVVMLVILVFTVSSRLHRRLEWLGRNVMPISDEELRKLCLDWNPDPLFTKARAIVDGCLSLLDRLAEKDAEIAQLKETVRQTRRTVDFLNSKKEEDGD